MGSGPSHHDRPFPSSSQFSQFFQWPPLLSFHLIEPAVPHKEWFYNHPVVRPGQSLFCDCSRETFSWSMTWRGKRLLPRSAAGAARRREPPNLHGLFCIASSIPQPAGDGKVFRVHMTAWEQGQARVKLRGKMHVVSEAPENLLLPVQSCQGATCACIFAASSSPQWQSFNL